MHGFTHSPTSSTLGYKVSKVVFCQQNKRSSRPGHLLQMIFCWYIWCISLLSFRNKAKKKKWQPSPDDYVHQLSESDSVNASVFSLSCCDFHKVIILGKNGLDLGSEIFLLNTAVLIKCNPRRTVFSCTNETGRAWGYSESNRGNWAAESVGHKLWEEWNHLSGSLEVNYLVKI